MGQRRVIFGLIAGVAGLAGVVSVGGGGAVLAESGPGTQASTRPSVRGTDGSTTRPVRHARRTPSTLPSFKSLPPLARPFTGTTRPSGTPLSVTTERMSLDELVRLQERVEAVSQKVIPTVVCLQIGGGSGSGVIVSPDGWVLTAGHVSGEPDQDVTVVLHDGRKVRAKTLGGNKGVDSGLVRLVDPGPWPYAELGESATLRLGQWLVAVGHPGGYKIGRPPVVRLGRLLAVERDEGTRDINTLETDATLVGGDSGGPLFDLEGRVVGIHSRIGRSVATNMHVPVDVFVRDWDRVAAGEDYGSLGGVQGPRNVRTPWLGAFFQNQENDGGVRIVSTTPGSPADMAGLKPGDVITAFAGEKVRNVLDLQVKLRVRRPGDEVKLSVRREAASTDAAAGGAGGVGGGGGVGGVGGGTMELSVKLGEPRPPRERRRPRDR